MSVTIASKLPKGSENGLAHMEGQLAAKPDDVTVVVGLVRTDRITNVPHDTDNPRIVTTALLHVEAITTEADAKRTEKLLRSVYEQRTGKKELPFEDDQLDGED